MTTNGHSHRIQTNEVIEAQNDQLMEQMSDKIKTLRTLSIDIGEEVRTQNQDLGGMGDDFDTTGSLLGSSMKRLKAMGNAGHNRWMLYIVIFIIVLFFLLYYIIRLRT